MEKITLYQAVVEKQTINKEEDIEIYCLAIGRFSDKKDAEIACKLYMLANKDKVNREYDNSECTGNYMVRGLSCSNVFTPGPEYLTLDNFIKGNLQVALYRKHIGNKAMQKLLKEIGDEIQEDKELRIIERLIKEYNDKLHFALMTSSTSEESIEKIEESIKYLESLRNKTAGFTK